MISHIFIPTLKKVKTCSISFANGVGNFKNTCGDSLLSTDVECTPECEDGYIPDNMSPMKCTTGQELVQNGTCTGKARNKRGRGELLISIDNFGVAFIFLTLG